MKSLRYAKRGQPLKVAGLSEHMCSYGAKQLAKFGIKEGAELEIDPSFVSQVLLNVNGKYILLGYESARMIIIGQDRLTDMRPGSQGKITDIEGGYEAFKRFKDLGLSAGAEMTLRAFPCHGCQYIRVQGAKIVTEDMRELLSLPPVTYLMVDVNGTEKQISLMETGEKGKFTRIIADHGRREKYDREWIKEGNLVEVMHRLDPESVPLIVRVDNKNHVVGAGLAEKIFVEE